MAADGGMHKGGGYSDDDAPKTENRCLVGHAADTDYRPLSDESQTKVLLSGDDDAGSHTDGSCASDGAEFHQRRLGPKAMSTIASLEDELRTHLESFPV